jgi:hypothetical protein
MPDEFKPTDNKPPDNSLSQESIRRKLSGSFREKETFEVGDIRSRNFISGVQGWRITPNGVEFYGGSGLSDRLTSSTTTVGDTLILTSNGSVLTLTGNRSTLALANNFQVTGNITLVTGNMVMGGGDITGLDDITLNADLGTVIGSSTVGIDLIHVGDAGTTVGTDFTAGHGLRMSLYQAKAANVGSVNLGLSGLFPSFFGIEAWKANDLTYQFSNQYQGSKGDENYYVNYGIGPASQAGLLGFGLFVLGQHDGVYGGSPFRHGSRTSSARYVQWGMDASDFYVLDQAGTVAGLKIDMAVIAKTAATWDIGTASLTWRDLFLSGAAYLGAATTSKPSLRMPVGTAPSSPTVGDVWNDSTQKSIIGYIDTVKQALLGVLFTQTADKAVTNTVTETTILGTGVGTLTLPANFFVAGKTIRIKISGVYSTVVVTGDTVTVKVKCGSTVIASKTTSSLLTGATNLFWAGEIDITCRTTGATGTVQPSGSVWYQVTTVGGIAEDELNNGAATATIDTTTSNALDVTVTHGAADASNSIKSLVATVEVLN